jgi:hypothetical protein
LLTDGQASTQLVFNLHRSVLYCTAQVWPMFDPDGSDSIDAGEFLAPDGLADTIVATARHM